MNSLVCAVLALRLFHVSLFPLAEHHSSYLFSDFRLLAYACKTKNITKYSNQQCKCYIYLTICSTQEIDLVDVKMWGCGVQTGW
jgi:hypothetical protein